MKRLAKGSRAYTNVHNCVAFELLCASHCVVEIKNL